MPQISVIIPVYNSGEYLERSIESVLNQTFYDFELIVVDDGSNDNSIQIIKKFMERDKRIILVEQSNQYAGIARNNGMKIAKGEYLLFLDSDDFFEPNMLEMLRKKADDKKADVVICNAYFYDNDTGEVTEPSWVLRKEYIPNIEDVFSYSDIMHRIFQISLPVPWNKLYRRSFVENNSLYFQNIKRSNDELFVNLSLILAERLCVLDERLLTYRVNNQASLQGMGKEYEVSYDFAYALRAIKNELVKRRVYEDVKVSFINKCLSSCMAVLRKQKNVYNFESIYMFLKKKFFDEMEIIGWNKEFYYSNYEEMQKIVMYTPKEYLYYKNKIEENGKKFVFPYKEVGKCRNIILYAAGEMGKSYYKQIFLNEYYHIVAWVDINYLKYCNYNVKIDDPQKIKKLDFEKVVIAIEDSKTKEKVVEFLLSLGIDEEKVV
jgi:glycosyltransferase involved in cell wall biosynthesis